MIEKVIENQGGCNKKVEVVKPVVSRVKKQENKGKLVADQLSEYRQMQKTKGSSMRKLGVDRTGQEDGGSGSGYVPPNIPEGVGNTGIDFRGVCVRVFELVIFK